MSTVSQRAALTPRQLTRTAERTSFIYLERCTVHREANAITAQDAEGTTHIPSATINTLLLGPGTRITHQAMSVLGETGAAVCWVGEQGVRYYASGRALSRSSTLVEAQARQWASTRSRLAVARAMYRMRFPDEDPAGLTRHELLGREGKRVKECYRAEASRTGVRWRGRRYTPGDFTSGDAANQAITAAAQCM
jgi:CRISPR-associated protein Cas1